MKILSPLSKPEEVKPLSQAGAQEFYCGIVPKEWEKRFSLIASSNLRHDRVANFQTFEQLSKAVQTASSEKKPVYCTFNALFYSEKQMPLVLKHISQAIDAGISKIIVSDPGLLFHLNKDNTGIEAALSTAAVAFNSQAIALFKGLGVKRFVLPRHLTAKEILDLSQRTKHLNVELEAFVLNALCPNIDGLCTFQHVGKDHAFIKPEELACRMPFSIEVFSSQPEAKQLSAKAKASIWQNTLPFGCGLCALPLFQEAGIHSLKIAGRGNPTAKKIADVKLLKEAISLLSLSQPDFLQEMHRLFFQSNLQTCSSTKCYFPEEGLP